MKISKIMLTLFILLTILTATVVSATEDVENMTAEAPLEEIESSDVDTVIQTYEEEQLEEKTDLDYNQDEILGEVSEDIVANESSTDFDLNVYFPKIVYGDSTSYFDAYVPENADGTLTLYINGEFVEEWNDFDWYGEVNSFEIYLENPKSTNTWKVNYTGDSSYSDTFANGTFEYKMVEIPEITDLSGNFQIEIENQEGVLILLIDDKQIFNDFFKYMTWVPFENLTVGNHRYEIILYDNSNQMVFDENGTFYADYRFNPFVKEGYPLVDEIQIPIDLPDDATGNVLVSYNGANFTYEINDGMAYVTLENLKEGEEEIIFTYLGDDKYPRKTVRNVISIEGYAIVPYEDLGNYYISLTLPSGAVGKLNISLTDEYMTFKKFLDSVDLVDGTAKYVFAPGNYFIWAEYNGTGYDVEPLVYSFVVFPHIQVSDVIFGENATIDIYASNASENFTIYINDEEICNVTLDENGRKTLNVNTLELKKLGDNTITVSYNGTQLVNDFGRPFNVRFTVFPGTFTIPEQFGFDKSANMTLSLSEYARGNVSVLAISSIGGQEYLAQNVSVSGNAIVPLSAEKSGFYILFIQYVDENYGSFSTQAQAYVPKPDAGADIVIPQTVTSDTLEIALPEDATGLILAIIDGKSKIYNLVDGSANIDLSGLSKGSHDLTIKYAGDDNYEKFEKTASFAVPGLEPKLDVKTEVDAYGNVKVTATAEKNATGNVTITIIDAVTGETVDSVVGELDEGSYVLGDIGYNFKKGKYNVTVAYGGDDYYSAETVNATFTIDKEIISPKTTQLDVEGGEVNITVDLGVNATGKVHVVYPSGFVDNVTIENGKVNFFNVFMRETGPLSVVLDYDGDDNYYGFFEYYIDFTIKKATFITAKPISVVYKNNAKWTINLKDADNKAVSGQTIKVTLNGKTFTGKTDAKGNAVVTIPANLVPKAYTAKIVFAGTALLEDDFDNVKFTVKKATPKMTVKKKTFKAKTKVKKYTIVLKDHKKKAMKKVKVTLKVKGKTYTAKTNAKGKAVFKIKNLKKKGTYKAKITFKANKYFNKVTKTVKIKVKR